MKKTLIRIGTLVMAVIMIAGMLPAMTASASAYTLEEKQRAVVMTAFAYYDKGIAVQYDSKSLSAVSGAKGGATRTTQEVAPEEATPDETIYSVCSDFTYQVYYNAFGFKCCGNASRNVTATMSKYEPGVDPICAYKYDSRKDSTPRADAITKYLEQLQPGDIINSVGKVGGGGHAMLYVGDVLGDGTKYILHCAGRKYNTKTGEDIVEIPAEIQPEVPGKIKLSVSDTRKCGIGFISAETYLRMQYTKSKNRVLSIIRPLNVITDDMYQMSEAAKTRMQFPRLVYNRTASPYTRFEDVEAGGTVTLKVELKNLSKEAYTVPVKEVVPEGVTFVKASDGAAVNGKEITWSVALGAGETKVVSYDCTVTAPRGEIILFTGGKAGEIPSNTLRIPVGGKHLTDAENALLTEMANGGHADLYAGSKKDDVPSIVYGKLLNLNIKLPTSTQLVKNVLEKTTYAGKAVYIPKEAVKGDALNWRKMIVPEFYGGFRNGEMDSRRRVLDLKCDYLQPGDIVYEISKYNKPAGGQTIVYLGNKLFLGQGENGTAIVDWFELQKAHTYDLFFALRPTLAYDDIHTPETTKNVAKSEKLKFNDVKESDWYYKFVKELVKNGTVSGVNETTFDPNGTLTWGQALKLISAAVYSKELEKETPHWASGWYHGARARKWLDKDVDLDKPITRLELCRVAAKAKGLTEQPSSNPFTDTDDKDVLALYRAKVVSGVTATEFRPNDLLTRAQISKIISALRAAKTPEKKKTTSSSSDSPASSETSSSADAAAAADEEATD